MRETSVDKNTSNKQYLKLISFEHSRMHEVDWQFEDLEYLETINTLKFKLLSNITCIGLKKLFPPELMDIKFGRSTFFHFESFYSYFA